MTQTTRSYNHFLSRGLTALAKVQVRARVTAVTVTAEVSNGGKCKMITVNA